MAALSRFLSVGGDKGYPYFQCLKKNNRFTWTSEFEEAFLKLKEYLASLSVLCKPLPSILHRLYFAVTDRVISSVIVQEQVQRPIYFASKVLQGPEVRYQAIEKCSYRLTSFADSCFGPSILPENHTFLIKKPLTCKDKGAP